MYELSAIRHERNCRTNYEIHVRTSTGWGVSASRGEMVDAVAAARRALGQPGAEAVRVVRDVFDPAVGTSKMTTVFRAAAEPEDRSNRYLPEGWVRRARALATAQVPPRHQFASSLALSLIAVGCGTVFNWLRS